MTLSQFLLVTREHYQIALLDKDFRSISELKPRHSFHSVQDIHLLERQVIDFVIVDYTTLLVRIE